MGAVAVAESVFEAAVPPAAALSEEEGEVAEGGCWLMNSNTTPEMG